MINVPIIGLHGKARAGKDTVANFIIAIRGGYQYSFADPIRAMLRPLGIDMYDPYWIERKEEIIPALGVSPRRMMQTLGTEWGRQMVNEDLWLILAKQKLRDYGGGMIIADVRFENEAQWVRDQGGRIVHVMRKDAAKVENHASEGGVVVHEEDLLIHNDGSLEDLRETVKRMCDVSKT